MNKHTTHFIILLLFTMNVFRSGAQTIRTIAGTGVAGSSGDGGPATNANMRPGGVVIDHAGNMYISDAVYHVIRKVNPSGIVSTIAGTGVSGSGGDGGPATAATFDKPLQMAMDRTGNLYFPDYNRYCVRKISTTGIITTVAGSFYGSSPDGLPATASGLMFPIGVALDTADNLYISDQTLNKIMKVNPSGIMTTYAGKGTFAYSGDGGPATAAELFEPEGIVTDIQGNIYFADANNQCIRKVDAGGIITTIAGNGVNGFGGDGGPATAANLSMPAAVAIDNLGNVYAGDYGNSRIRKIDASGNISTVVGAGTFGYNGEGLPATAAFLAMNANLYMHPSGDLYIPEVDNNRLRVVNCLSGPFVNAITGSDVLCKNTPLSLSDATAGGTWSSGNTEVAVVGTGGAVTGISKGTATITYSYINACGTGTSAKTITVDSIPDAGTISGVDSICSEFPVTLSHSVSGGTWLSKNPSIITISSTGTAHCLSSPPGIDTILYIVAGPCGIDTATFSMRIRTMPCEAAVHNIGQQPATLSIYPTPNDGIFKMHITSQLTVAAHFIITDMMGRQIKELDITTNRDTEVRLDAPSGIYFLSATAGQEKLISKIVIR